MLTTPHRDHELIRLSIDVDGHPAIALVDSGASDNFVSAAFAARARLPLERLVAADTFDVELGDGRYELVTHRLPHAVLQAGPVRVQQHLHVAPLGRYDAVLGMPWLAAVDPQRIDFRQKVVHGCWDDRPFALHGVADASTPMEARLISYKAMRRVLRKPGMLDAEQSLLVFVRSTDGAAAVSKDEPVSADVEDIVREFSDVFPPELPPELPPRRAADHHIRLRDPAAEPPARPPYRVPEAYKPELRKQIEELLRLGHIQPSVSPYGAPVLFVRKKGGDLRLCVDYRLLNEQTVKDRTAQPVADELFDGVAGSTWFSKIDLRSGW